MKTLEEYLQRTYQHRDKHSQLLLSYIQPFKPVSKETIARWVKVVLKSAGIDVAKYSAHSSRAASTSHHEEDNGSRRLVERGDIRKIL